MRTPAPFLLAALLGLAACTATSSNGPADPTDQRSTGEAGTDVSLAPGASVDVAAANLRVKFVKVSGDSRCPTNGQIYCVWAGSAVVQLEASTLTGAEQPVAVQLETMNTRDSTTVLGQPLKLVRVDPAKTTTTEIPSAQYRAVIRVGRAK